MTKKQVSIDISIYFHFFPICILNEIVLFNFIHTNKNLLPVSNEDSNFTHKTYDREEPNEKRTAISNDESNERSKNLGK